MKKNKKCTFISKPEASTQGKGIFLFKNIEDITQNDNQVVQNYLAEPYLIDGLKFDLRIYVLLYGRNPLRIFFYKEGLMRFAVSKYQNPTDFNIDNVHMHLTNYSLNKHHPSFSYNKNSNGPETGHKRSLTYLLDYLDKNGKDSKKLMAELKKIIIKTLCSVQPNISSHNVIYDKNYADDVFFELMGYPWTL